MSRYSEDTQEYRDGVKLRIHQKRAANPSRYLWDKAKRRAKQAGLAFTIEPDDVVITETCPALGVGIQVLSNSHKSSATLDRIQNSKGYTPGNVQVISKRANTIKNDATFEELIRIALYVGKSTGRLKPNEIDKIAKLCGVR